MVMIKGIRRIWKRNMKKSGRKMTSCSCSSKTKGGRRGREPGFGDESQMRSAEEVADEASEPNKEEEHIL